jgi:hypothetical protein
MSSPNLKFPVFKEGWRVQRDGAGTQQTEIKNMKSLSEIFNSEAVANGQDKPCRQLSAAGGSNDTVPDSLGNKIKVVADADYSERLAILRKMIAENKRPRKQDSQLYSDTDLLALPLPTLRDLYSSTPSEAAVNVTGEPSKISDKGTINLAACFDAENSLTLLSARSCTSSAGSEDVERYRLIQSMVRLGQMPIKEDGFTHFNDKELLALPIITLKALAANCVRTVRVV